MESLCYAETRAELVEVVLKAVKMLDPSKAVPPSWSDLFDDLVAWSASPTARRAVRLRWMRDFYTYVSNPEKN